VSQGNIEFAQRYSNALDLLVCGAFSYRKWVDHIERAMFEDHPTVQVQSVFTEASVWEEGFSAGALMGSAAQWSWMGHYWNSAFALWISPGHTSWNEIDYRTAVARGVPSITSGEAELRALFSDRVQTLLTQLVIDRVAATVPQGE
jgi:hypothetical protein